MDYSTGHWTIQTAVLDAYAKHGARAAGPFFIEWGGRRVTTGDTFVVPRHGTLRIEFLRCEADCRQGVDIKLNGGSVLSNGDLLPILRTWCDARFEDVVEYQYRSLDGVMKVWNVYETLLPNGQKREDKWTENAGMWIDVQSELDRTYHCSPGPVTPPDFEKLVFRLTITSAS